MIHVIGAEYLDGYRLLVDFNDGFSGVVDLGGRLTGPVFRPLNEIDAFRQFKIDGHTVCWSNGADLAPEYLRELAAEHPAGASPSAESRRTS
jgi:hypothetical protein